MTMSVGAVGNITQRAAGADRSGVACQLRLSIVLDNLNWGGVQNIRLVLAREFARRGHQVDLIVTEFVGGEAEKLPAGVRLVRLKPGGSLATRYDAVRADPAGIMQMMRPILLARRVPGSLRLLPPLTRYLREQRPDALIAATRTINIAAVWAARLARSGTRVVVSEHISLSAALAGSRKWGRRHLPAVMRRAYGDADAVVAVSAGVADDLAQCTGLQRQRIRTIYNPAVTSETTERAAAPLEHRWFDPGEPPVILGAGRLHEQKDFATLVRAFARLRRDRAARLVILGSAASPALTVAARAKLMALATELGVSADLDLPGFVANPLAFMARSAVFVLSSRWEGLPAVLIEALACGCPVVSTDCPSGPAEILEGGCWGELVPIGDAAAMADAIARTLDQPRIRARLQSRAEAFGVDVAVGAYLNILTGAAGRSNPTPLGGALGG